MKNFSIQKLVTLAAVAAVYVAMTLVIAPLAYGPIQFRFSEILVLLCFYNKDYCYSMVAGCAIANLFSPMAAMDVPFGTAATLISVLCMVFFAKKLWVASLFPVIINGIVVGIELYVALNEPLLFSMATVALGELVVVTVLGVPFFKLLERNAHIKKYVLMAQA